MFCHHPDVLHYMWRAFTDLGHTVYIATEELTNQIGFLYSSIKNNKFEVVDHLYDPQTLFPDMYDTKWAYNMEYIKNADIVWSMLPEILSLRNKKVVWFDAQMQGFLRNPQLGAINNAIKTANHPDAYKINNFHFMPNWVSQYDQKIDKSERKLIVQLITQADLVAETAILMNLKNRGYPVKIYGGAKCPDGFIRDLFVLPHTKLLVHNKTFGINCYAVCKALDMGIPVYMSKETKELIGFGDLPDSLFIFSNECSIEQAARIADFADNKHIQDTYRSIYTLERTKAQAAQLIEETKKFNIAK